MIPGPCHCAETAPEHRDHPNLCASCAHQRQPRVNWETEWCHLATTGTEATQARSFTLGGGHAHATQSTS